MDRPPISDNLTPDQNYQGVETVNMFANFLIGATIADKDLLIRVANFTLSQIPKEVAPSLRLVVLDFKDPNSINSFVKFCEENKELMLTIRNNPEFQPKDIKNSEFESYPVFLFLDPTNFAYMDEHQLGIEKSTMIIEHVKTIVKHGRVNLGFTPESFAHTGTKYPDVPVSYTMSLSNPADANNKLNICRYLSDRSAIQELGLSDRVTDPHRLFTPANEALEKNIIS